MARLESEGKAGFYPTPIEEMELILKRLSYSTEGSISLLDPCCGKGDVLKHWKNDALEKGSLAKSYGIELEKSRANEAKQKNDYILQSAYEEVRMSHNAFSAIYLNPPFMNVNGSRIEKKFLSDLTAHYLQPGGLLIFNIPQHALRDCAKIIVSRFEQISIYRFTDKNYHTYKQVIVYGYRRKKGAIKQKDREYQMKMEKKLYNLSFLGKEAIPSLNDEDWHKVHYIIPTQKRDVTIFESLRIEKEDILRSLKETCFLEKVESKIIDSSIDAKKIVPAANLKTTHIAAVIASGALPEEMGDHLLVGVTKRIEEESIEVDLKTSQEKIVTTFKPKSTVRIFSEKGIFNLK